MILRSNSFSDINKTSYVNIMDAVQSVLINDPSYFNKTIASSRRFKQAVKSNKLVKNVFNFLESNELMCILADKNLGLTIIDKSWYVEHMLKHFQRSEVFGLGVESSCFDVAELHVQPWLQTQFGKFRSHAQAIALATEFYDKNACQVPQAYGLIKLHKQPHKLRVITPVVDWINVKAAREVANRLSIYVKYFTHILGNSSELVREFDGMLSFNYVIASYDVSDMYNSIVQEDCVGRLESMAKVFGWWDNSTDKWWQETITLIEFVFETSYVGFGGHVYKQKRGLPMGSPLSPVLANLFLAALEQDTEPMFREYGFSYFRYLDDVLMIHSSDARMYAQQGMGTVRTQHLLDLADEFIKGLTELTDGTICFERTGVAWRVGDYVEYLDLKVKIGQIQTEFRDKVINFEVFDKPTNLHIYTDPSTFYPFSYVYHWIQGENIRLIRNSSSPDVYQKSLEEFKRFLVWRKYSQDLIERFVQLNYFDDRDELLQHEKPHKNRKESKDVGSTKYVAVRNAGTRPLVTKAINVIDSFCQNLELVDFRIQPVVTQGGTLVSVMNKAKKNLRTQKFDSSSLN